MLVVVTVMGIIAGVTLPRVNFAQHRANAAAAFVRGTLQQAQRMAIVRQFDVVVMVDTVAGKLRVLEDADNDGRVDAGERVSSRPLEEGARFAAPSAGVNGPAARSIVGAGLRTVDGLPAIVFHRNGSSSTNLELYLSVRGRRSPEMRAVTVAQATGRAEWFRRSYDDARWNGGGL
jgi:type II secretory pathway pseudopilin PulG